MQPTIEILENINQNSQQNGDEVFTRLYRYLLRPDIYYVAYKNLYANNGASTKGVDDDTADGFGEEKIQRLINSLSDESYYPKPSRRTYIKKQNGKKRPLGIPTFSDKLVQEVLRMVLEAVYEPVFRNTSHGFRPKRSCHTALKMVQNNFKGVRWFIEGDIKGCFDNINHNKLIEIIGRKIKDARLIKLLYKFLKAGYLEEWIYNNTHSGTPQGGIVSPILANIYLHELDLFAEKLKTSFDKPQLRYYNSEYDKARSRVYYLRKQIGKAEGDKREQLIDEMHKTRSIMLKLPAKSQTDKKLVYVRYADDFLIGINGSKEECEEIKAQLKEFISSELAMELSEEKTLITHSNEYARFLGHDVRIRRDFSIKPGGNGHTQRTLSNSCELNVPLNDKIHKYLFTKGIVEQKASGELEPVKRGNLIRLPDIEIIDTFNAELRGICNFYGYASNFSRFTYLSYLFEYSLLKTLAAKHQCTIAKIKGRFKDGKGKWCIPYETKKGIKHRYFANWQECKKPSYCKDELPRAGFYHLNSRSTFEERLNAKQCELCGTTKNVLYEIHHVNKVRNLKGKTKWEQCMIAKRRKTLVVCKKCHLAIHNNKV